MKQFKLLYEANFAIFNAITLSLHEFSKPAIFL